MSIAVQVHVVPGLATGPIVTIVCDDPQAHFFQMSALLAQEALQLPNTLSDGVSRVEGQLDQKDWSPQLLQALTTIDAGHWRLFTIATVSQGPLAGRMAVGMGSNKARLTRASNLALAVTALRFGPSLPRNEYLRELDASVQLRELNGAALRALSASTSQSAAVATHVDLRPATPPPPPPPPFPPPKSLFRATEKQPPAQYHSQPADQPPPDARQVPVPMFISAVDGCCGKTVAVADGLDAVPVAPPSSTPDVESMSVDDIKHRLVAWRRQQPCLEKPLIIAVRRLMQCPAGDNGAHEEAFKSDDEECFRALQAVVERDTWKGHSFGKDWVHAWLKWGEPFDIEDPTACCKAIAGKTEQKQRDNWKWYFGSAPWMQLIVRLPLVPLRPAKPTMDKQPSPQTPVPAFPPTPSSSVSSQPPGPASPSAPRHGVETSSFLGGVWEFEAGTRWSRFSPEQNTRLEDAWRENQDIVVFNAGGDFQFEVDLVAMHQTMSATGAVWKVRRQVSQPVLGEGSGLLPAGAKAGPSADLQAHVPETDFLEACRPVLPEPDRDQVLIGLSRYKLQEDADPAAVLSAHACRPVLPEPDRHQVLTGLSRDNAEDALTIRTLGSMDSIPIGTDLDTGFYRNLWAAGLVSDPGGGLVVQCNRGMRVIDAENVGFSYGEGVFKRQTWHREGVRLAVQHFVQEGLHVILVTPRRHLKDMEEDRVDVVIAENSNGTDDVQVLKQAHAHNCPWVSRDGAKDWMKDWRLSSDLRQWVQKYSFLQVRWSWGPRGDFVPDFDLPTPSLRPSNGAKNL